MGLYEKICNGQETLSLIGLGYVGLPIAAAFAQKVKVIGFDTSKEKIALYKSGIDPTKEIGDEAVKSSSIQFTADEDQLQEAKFHIVAVPTPIRADRTPDLVPIQEASRILGRNLTVGAIVVYESTVYPGVTEEICIPILEAESGLQCGIDFKIGYSPERINPGDKEHRLENIIKIVSGMDEETLEEIAQTYELVVKAGVHKAASIKIAEAAKVIENSQRDINIAFMNELSVIFHKMGIDTKAVLEAAATKWNFLRFSPGLVGGHCIGVDPYYLTYKAEQMGYRSKVILSGRQINDDMGKYVAENLVKYLIQADIPVKQAKIAILGITFKENCPDVRNTKVMDIYKELKEYGNTPIVCDPIANPQEVNRQYGIELERFEELTGVHAVVLAVAHQEYQKLEKSQLQGLYANKSHQTGILFDLKGIVEQEKIEDQDLLYWRL